MTTSIKIIQVLRVMKKKLCNASEMLFNKKDSVTQENSVNEHVVNKDVSKYEKKKK